MMKYMEEYTRNWTGLCMASSLILIANASFVYLAIQQHTQWSIARAERMKWETVQHAWEQEAKRSAAFVHSPQYAPYTRAQPNGEHASVAPFTETAINCTALIWEKIAWQDLLAFFSKYRKAHGVSFPIQDFSLQSAPESGWVAFRCTVPNPPEPIKGER